MADDDLAEAKVGTDPDLQALVKQLEAAQAKEGAAPKGPASAAALDQTILGYTPAALFLGLVISTAGIACIRYAKVTSRLGPLLLGIALFALAVFVKDARILLGASVGIAILTLLVNRYVKF